MDQLYPHELKLPASPHRAEGFALRPDMLRFTSCFNLLRFHAISLRYFDNYRVLVQLNGISQVLVSLSKEHPMERGLLVSTHVLVGNGT